MKEYKITFHARLHRTLAVEISAETEEDAINGFNDEQEYYTKMAEIVATSWGVPSEDLEIDIQKVECIYEGDEDDDLPSN